MTSKNTTKKKFKKKQNNKPAALDINKAENIEITFTIDDALYTIKPKAGSRLDAEINLQTVLRLALDKHDPDLIVDVDIMDLENKTDEIAEAK